MWFWLFQPTAGIVLTAVGTILGINGSVQDATGGAIAGVPVTATDVASGKVATVTTNSTGNFSFSPIGVGVYRVSVVVGGVSAEKQVSVIPPP